MRFRIFTEPQEGATYDDQLAVALLAEELGFDAYFRSDHYIGFFNPPGLPGPTDAWITLAGLARDTSTPPAGHARLAGHVPQPGPARDHRRPGRRDERRPGGARARRGVERPRARGLRHPVSRHRRAVRTLEEQLEIITGLWDTPIGGSFSYDGRHYPLTDSPALPKPVQQPHPPIVIGGFGPKRTPRLAATYATEFNVALRAAARVPGHRRTRACRMRAQRSRHRDARHQPGQHGGVRCRRRRGRAPRRGDRARDPNSSAARSRERRLR